jgi:glycosyltransferase involved in cell wall biosynthesis
VEKYLARCVDSILSQTFANFECILVNDCSPDDSPALCDKYAEKDSRIRVIHKTKNGGLPQARKTGFEQSTGEYIIFVDSDDWIEFDMIEKLYAKTVQDNLDVCICDMYVFSPENEQHLTYKFKCDTKIEIVRQMLAYTFFNAVCNKLIRRDIYNLVVFPVYNQGEDRVITAQTLYYADTIGFIPDKLYHVFPNPSSLCRNPDRLRIRMIELDNNYSELILFLRDTFGDLRVFEPELSACIYKRKLAYVWPKETRNKEIFRKFDTLYPVLHDCIKGKRHPALPIRSQILLFLAEHKLYSVIEILDLLTPLYRKLKNILKRRNP